MTKESAEPSRPKSEWFDVAAQRVSTFTGHASWFLFCVLLVVVWAPTIFLFKKIDTWQLLINTTTTIITFLQVSIIQNAQNRNDLAVNTKLDALVQATPGASDRLRRLEERSEHEILREREREA